MLLLVPATILLVFISGSEAKSRGSSGSITRPCDPSIIGTGLFNCSDLDPTGTGNANVIDLPLNDPRVTHPSDGQPWGIRLTGPYPDGTTYLVTWLHGDASVGSASSLPPPDTRGMVAWARLSDVPTAGVRSRRVSGDHKKGKRRHASECPTCTTVQLHTATVLSA